jgi:hypothetical protein
MQVSIRSASSDGEAGNEREVALTGALRFNRRIFCGEYAGESPHPPSAMGSSIRRWQSFPTMQIRVSFVSDPWQNQGREATFYTVSSMNRPLHGYRGRLAPTPTGYLHSGHGQTFWIAAERARRAGGTLVYRNEDLDLARCKPEFATAAMEDMRWLGIEWQEGPDVGGSFAPYTQSERQSVYREAWKRLHATGMIYPSPHSRKDVAAALGAPH